MKSLARLQAPLRYSKPVSHWIVLVVLGLVSLGLFSSAPHTSVDLKGQSGQVDRLMVREAGLLSHQELLPHSRRNESGASVTDDDKYQADSLVSLHLDLPLVLYTAYRFHSEGNWPAGFRRRSPHSPRAPPLFS